MDLRWVLPWRRNVPRLLAFFTINSCFRLRFTLFYLSQPQLKINAMLNFWIETVAFCHTHRISAQRLWCTPLSCRLYSSLILFHIPHTHTPHTVHGVVWALLIINRLLWSCVRSFMFLIAARTYHYFISSQSSIFVVCIFNLFSLQLSLHHSFSWICFYFYVQCPLSFSFVSIPRNKQFNKESFILMVVIKRFNFILKHGF